MKRALPDTDTPLSWYEATLSLRERKQRGHFSTPAPLVERILDVCGYTAQRELAALRVLDPACGSGNFLVAAARRLLAYGERVGYTREEGEALVQSNIWGFDPDPIACFLAEMHLNDAIGQSKPVFHIHQSDALAVPWEPCVDLFLANPPYLAAKNIDLSGYRSAQKRGQVDSYLLFLGLGMQVVRPNGWLGLVLPDALLARANAAEERARLLRDFTIHQLWHLSGTFAAQVGAVVIIAQKTPPKSTHQVTWIREKWNGNGEGEKYCIPQALFSRQPRAEFRYLHGNTHDTTLDRLCLYESELELDRENTSRRFVPLGDLLSIHRGEELGRKSEHVIPAHLPAPRLTPTRDVTTFSRADPPTCSDTPCGCQARGRQAHHFPLLRGGIDARPYTEPSGEWSIAREHIAKPLNRYTAPKLLVVKSTAQLQAALDLRGHVVLQTLYILQLKENHVAGNNDKEDDLYFFLALLNASLLREFVYVQYTAYKWVQPQIEQYVLANLPIPLCNHEQKQEIIERAKRLVELCSCSQPSAVVEWDEMIQDVYAEQERAIRALYEAALQ